MNGNGFSYELPPTATDVPPAFTDAAGCKAWLVGLPLANPVQSQALLLRQIGLLNRYTLLPGERLRIAEMLRGPVLATQDGAVRRFAGKALPLAPAEQAAFESTQALWQALANSYLRCLHAVVDSTERSTTLVAQAALIAQRILASLTTARNHAIVGGRIPAAGMWQLMYRVYWAAERFGSAGLAVEDKLRHAHEPTNAAAALVEAVLVQMAAPHELAQRQQGWLFRWARHWSGKVPVLPRVPGELKAVPLYLDLESDRPPGVVPHGEAGKRWLDVGELRSSIKRRLSKLAAGTPPVELGLGEDCVMPGGETLLRYLYQRWCKGGGIRRNERIAGRGDAQVVGDAEAIYFHLSGKRFAQPAQAAVFNRRYSDEIATFGRIATHHLEAPAPANDFVAEQWKIDEEWRVADDTATGLQMSRPLTQARGRLGSGQLISLRPDDGKQFLLGVLRWIRVDEHDTLHASANLYGGFPQPLAIKGTGVAAVNEKYRPGFLMPEVAVLRLPQRILLPVGLFRAGAMLDVIDAATGERRELRLVELIERGIDFDYATCQAK